MDGAGALEGALQSSPGDSAEPAAGEPSAVLATLKSLAEVLSKTPQGGAQGDLKQWVLSAADEDLLKHPDRDVRKWVSLCLAEALYVFAPTSPFTAEQARAVLELFLEQLNALLEPDSSYYEHAADLLDRIIQVCGFTLAFESDDSDKLMIRLTQLFVSVARAPGGSKQSEVDSLLVQGLGGLLGETDEIPKPVLVALIHEILPQNRGSRIAGLVRSILGSFADRASALSINNFVNEALHDAAEGDALQFESLYGLVCELFFVDPALVARVLPNLHEDLQCQDVKRRCCVTKSVGQMLAYITPQVFASSRSPLVVTNPLLVGRFLERLEDGEEDVRLAALEGTGALLKEAAKHANHDRFFLEGNGLVSEKHIEDAPLAQAVARVVEVGLEARSLDPSDAVRLRVVEIAAEVAMTKGGFKLLEAKLPSIFRRILDKKINVREGCVDVLGRLYAQHALPRASRSKVQRFELRFARDWRSRLAVELTDLGLAMKDDVPIIEGSVQVTDVEGTVWDVFAKDDALPDKKKFPLTVECKREVAGPGFHCPSCLRSWAPGEEPAFGICHCHAKDGTKLEEGMLESPMAVERIAWAAQCLCQAYPIFASSRIGPTRQLEECLERDFLGCGLPARERAAAIAKLYASVSGHEAAERGFHLLLGRKRDSNAALRRFVQLRLSKSAPMLEPAAALVPLDQEGGQAAQDSKKPATSPPAHEALALLVLLARQSPVMEDRGGRLETYVAALRSFDMVKNRDLWVLLQQLLGTEAAETTSELGTLVAELNRLLRVHNLENTLRPLLRRALLCTWLLPDQVPELLELWCSGGDKVLSYSAGRAVEELPRSIPGAFLPHLRSIVGLLKDASVENARITLRVLGALGKRTAPVAAPVSIQVEEVLSAAANVAAAASDGSAFRKALRCFRLLSKDKFWATFKKVVRWSQKPPVENAEAATLRSMAACIEHVAGTTDCPEDICRLMNGEEWLARARSTFQSGLEGQMADVCKAAVELYAAAGAESELLDSLGEEEQEVDALTLHVAVYTLRALRRHVVPLTTQLLSRLSSQVYAVLFSARAAEEAGVLLRALLKFQKPSRVPSHLAADLRIASTLPTIFAFAPVKRHREAAQQTLQTWLARAIRQQQQQTESQHQQPLLDYAAACFVHFLSRADCFVKEAAEAVTKYPDSSRISLFFVEALLRSDPANRVKVAAAVSRVTQRVNLFVDREDTKSDRVHKAAWVLRYVLEKECPELGAQGAALAPGAPRGSMPAELFAVRKVEVSTQPVLTYESAEVDIVSGNSSVAMKVDVTVAAVQAHLPGAAQHSDVGLPKESTIGNEAVQDAHSSGPVEGAGDNALREPASVKSAGDNALREPASVKSAGDNSLREPASIALPHNSNDCDRVSNAGVAVAGQTTGAVSQEPEEEEQENHLARSADCSGTGDVESLSYSSDIPVPFYGTPREPDSITPRRLSFGSAGRQNDAAAGHSSAGSSAPPDSGTAKERRSRSGESSIKAKRQRHS